MPILTPVQMTVPRPTLSRPLIVSKETRRIRQAVLSWLQFCVLCSALAIGSLGFTARMALAQQDNMDEGLKWVDEAPKADVKERVNRGIQDLEKKEQQMKPQIEQKMEEYQKGGQYQVLDENYSDMPKRHPLLDSKGIADTSKEDYLEKDSKVIFNTETFAGCLEERQVMEGPYVEECKKRCIPGWVTWMPPSGELSCIPCSDQLCIPGTPGCFPCKYNQLYVSELYLPVYQSRTYPGRAMGSFDPRGDYLAKQDQQDEEYEYEKARDTAYDRHKKLFEEFYQETFQEQPQEDFEQAAPKDYYKAADYMGRDLNVAEGNPMDVQSNHTLVYMTNANRQLSRRARPKKIDQWKGYVEEDKCFFLTLPDPDKLAVSHATYGPEHEPLTYQYKHEDVTEPPGVKERGTAFGHSMIDKTSMQEIEQAIDEGMQSGSGEQQPDITNKMLGQYIEMNQKYYKKGMEEIGASKQTHYQDWLYHNFFRLYDSRNKEMLEDPFYAKVVAGFSFYTLNSLTTFEPNMKKKPQRRPLLWSFWSGRPGMDGQNYAGAKQPIGPGKVFSADKIQIIYPTINDGTRGSSCFRPESIAKGEYFNPDKPYVDDKVGSEGFWGFRRDLQKRLLDVGIEKAHVYVREVRIAYWEKRVNCYCTICGKGPLPFGEFYGCSVLNNGDLADDWFYGTKSLEKTPPILYPEVTLKQPVIEFRYLK